MADITQTAASVVKAAPATLNQQYVAGETIAAGMPVYKNASDGKLYKAKCAGTLAEATVFGVALNSVSANQPITVQVAGQITIGATVAVGTVYVSSSTYGGIAPVADLTTGNYLSVIGFASTAGILVLDLNPTGIVHA